MESEIYIHAAPAAVYAKFTDIASWSTWYPGVVQARWIEGQPWRDNAQFAVTVRNLLGLTSDGIAIVRMSSPSKVVVYEMNMSGLQIVATVNFEEDLGGCRLRIRKRHYGPLAFLLIVLGARQGRMLDAGLANLKAQIEGQPRR